MADLNLRVAFFPTYRADPDSYWLGLGVIAMIDAVRLSLTTAGGMLPWLLVLFFVASVNINRLRDAGRQGPLVIIPLAAGVVAKSVTALFAMSSSFLDEYLAARGIDRNDSAATMAAINDPALQPDLQNYMQNNPASMLTALDAAAWPSMWAFWLAVGCVGLWFSRMRVRPRAA
jgi:hypothetical protein